MIVNHFFDHHTLPPDPQFLSQSLGHAFGRALLRSSLGEAGLPEAGDLGMVGRSAAIAGLRRLIRKAGPAGAPVLVAGESGTGKELVAKALHDCSGRAQGPFVAVNCGGVAPSLIHSELFGHERGAFTGASAQRRGLIEAAHGGTLFLDEIAELPLELQATLLRFLQEKVIHRVGATRHVAADTRVIAASHVDLQAAVNAGRFREDLFYRVNVLQLVVPPLRERRDDIPLLAGHFLERGCAELGVRARGFGRPAMQALVAHDWPGNVRELNNRVQRALLLAEQRLIVPGDLGLAPERVQASETLAWIRRQAERGAVRSALERGSHNVTLAARELGISRMTLYRLMARHGITPDAA
jgi:two-component system response regulator HydG